MVSFSCAGCGDVLTKKKLNGHVNQCWGAAFTCIDCMTDFQGNSYMAHTSCMSEAQKYQGHLYRPEKEKKGNNNANKQNQNQNQNKQNTQQGYNHNQAQSKAVQPYVEAEIENQLALVDTMPSAPSPPSAAPDYEPKPNVFDFYAGQATPNASTADLTKFSAAEPTPSKAIVKFDTPAETPAPKKAKKDKAVTKSDKKRKRLHVDTSGGSSVDRDLEMPDAAADGPPGLHTGLTGGLKQLMPREGFFPPTPDSGDEGGEETPVKRKKAGKKEKKAAGLMQRMGAGLIQSATGRRTSGGETKRVHAEDGPRKKSKAIEYPKGKDSDSGNNEVVPFVGEEGEGALEGEAMARQLMAFVPGVEEGKVGGVSMDKALKRYHRMRKEANGLGREVEERELWRALRMRRNEQGEVVLFFA